MEEARRRRIESDFIGLGKWSPVNKSKMKSVSGGSGDENA